MKTTRLLFVFILSLILVAFSQGGLKILAAQAMFNQPEDGSISRQAVIQQRAPTVVVTLDPVKDNTLYESAVGGLSNGAGDYFFVGRTNQPSNTIRRGLIAFDLGSVPAGATIVSATLRLHLSIAANTTSEPVELRRLLTDWGEGASNASGNEGPGTTAALGDATWTHAFTPTTPWLTVGGDFTSTLSAMASVGNSVGFYEWTTTPELVADLQDWLDNPATNFGWILLGNETTDLTARRFDSRQNSTTGNRPQLIVEYTTSAADLTLNKAVNTLTPAVGELITYTLIISNSGSSDATGVVVSDTIPAGLNFVGPITLDPPGAGTIGTPPILADQLTISAGGQVTLTFPVTVDVGLSHGTRITNTATATGANFVGSALDQVAIIVVNATKTIFLPIVVK